MDADKIEELRITLQRLRVTSVRNRLQETLDALSLCVDCTEELDRQGLHEFSAVLRDSTRQSIVDLLAIVEVLQTRQATGTEDSHHAMRAA